MATGAGKSIVISQVAHTMATRTLVLQPSKELVEQNYEKMLTVGGKDADVGIYCASLNRREICDITYATIQSIYKKPELFMDFELVIIDECHQVNPENLGGMYSSFLKAINCKRVLGLTATPYRLMPMTYWQDGERKRGAKMAMINRIYPFFFKSIIYRIETDQLIEMGYLSPILYRKVDIGDMSRLKINSTGADYTAESLRDFWEMDIPMMKLLQVIQKIDEHCQRSLTFCSSLDQARRAREMLSNMGIRAEMVDGSTKPAERTTLVAGYRSGEFKHMLNVGVFTTGFDVPALDCIILARPTMSLALYYQMVGRGVRLDPERPQKKLRVYDLVRVVEKLGRVETIKVVKEKNSFKDKVITEVGDITGVALHTFATNNKPQEEF